MTEIMTARATRKMVRGKTLLIDNNWVDRLFPISSDVRRFPLL